MDAQQDHAHRRFPGILAFALNNRLRRFSEPPGRLISKLDLKPSDVVVDFGCGPGFYTIPIAKIVKRTIAVDISERMLKEMRSNAQKNNVPVELLVTDGNTIRIEDAIVDLILLNHVFHEIVNKQQVLREFLRILKGSGRLAIVERARGGSFSGKLGPPVIDPIDVIRDLESAGFVSIGTISHGNDAVTVGRRIPGLTG